MRPTLCLCLLLLYLPLGAQQLKNYRSDTLNFSLQARYLIVSFGAGVEFPFRQHSFGLQAGFNGVPAKGNIHLGFNVEKVGALEYKRYYPTRLGPGKQFYYGAYVMYKQTEHASPHDADWEGEWHDSEAVNLGPLWGYKWYKGQRTYFDLFLGVYSGWQWGELRWDNRDSGTGNRNPTYQHADKISYGIRLGLSFGFHPVKKKF